jgi:hypothetical protein
VFPGGIWTSLWDGKTVSGPDKLKISAPLDTIPVYLRSGALMPVQLNGELQFGKSMTGGRVDSLVVTPPKENESVSMLNARGEMAQVGVEVKAGRLSWTLENLSEMSYLLVYGMNTAVAVRVDGKVLPRVMTVGSVPIGWEADLAGNRLVIRLPSRQVEHSKPTMGIEVDF